jgi:hypothetical protein
MPKITLSWRVMMPPSYFGARASIATAWHWVGSPVSCTPRSSSSFSTVPRLFGVPRIRKLSAAGPQYCFSHSMFDSKPPQAATNVAARTMCCTAMPHRRRKEHAVVDVEIDHLGLVSIATPRLSAVR